MQMLQNGRGTARLERLRGGVRVRCGHIRSVAQYKKSVEELYITVAEDRY